MAGKKIVSLLPAATEIVFALGRGGQLVGRSYECDYPGAAQHLPVCSSARFLPGSDSGQINRQVLGILEQALSIYEIDKEKIRELNPDVVITQSQCKVCAVNLDDVQEALKGLLDKEVEIISLEPHTYADVLADIRRIAACLGAEQEAEELIGQAEERRDIIRHKLKFSANRPKVACIEWLSPLMVAGNWTPELVETAGGVALLAENGKHSPFVEFAAIQAADPEVIVVMPCGFSVGRTLQEIALLLDLPGWADLQAVKNNRVYIADGNQYFNRSGPRLTDSIEILAEIIHPRQFIFGYEGQGWMKFGN